MAAAGFAALVGRGVIGRLGRRDQGETRPLSPWIPSTPWKGWGLARSVGERQQRFAWTIDPDLVRDLGWCWSTANEPFGMRGVRVVKGTLANDRKFEMTPGVDVRGGEEPDAFATRPPPCHLPPATRSFSIARYRHAFSSRIPLRCPIHAPRASSLNCRLSRWPLA